MNNQVQTIQYPPLEQIPGLSFRHFKGDALCLKKLDGRGQCFTLLQGVLLQKGKILFPDRLYNQLGEDVRRCGYDFRAMLSPSVHLESLHILRVQPVGL